MLHPMSVPHRRRGLFLAPEAPGTALGPGCVVLQSRFVGPGVDLPALRLSPVTVIVASLPIHPSQTSASGAAAGAASRLRR